MYTLYPLAHTMVLPYLVHHTHILSTVLTAHDNFVMLLESLAKMFQVGTAKVLDGKVINDECKHDGVPLVAPETGGGGCLIVVKFGKAVSDDVVGKDACLGETVHATAHFRVEPGVTGKLVELVLVNDFLGDVRKLDAGVLWPVKWGVEVEVLEVHGGKPSITLGENTVDEQFDKFNRARGGIYISRIQMLLPPMVICVRSASSPFSGWTLQTILE